MSDTPPKLDHQALLQRASDTIAALERRLARLEQARREPIAIVGMGMRLPGDIDDAASFWRLLREGVDAVGEIPPERWDVDAYYDPNPDTPGKTATRWGAFLNDVDAFDGRFFGISPREAAAMDVPARAASEPRVGDLLEEIESLSEDEADELFADLARRRAGASSWS